MPCISPTPTGTRKGKHCSPLLSLPALGRCIHIDRRTGQRSPSALTPGGCFHQLGAQMRKHVEECPWNPCGRIFTVILPPHPNGSSGFLSCDRDFPFMTDGKNFPQKLRKAFTVKILFSSVSRLNGLPPAPSLICGIWTESKT